jgi:hypothetical protein
MESPIMRKFWTLLERVENWLIPDRPGKFGLTRRERRLFRREAQTLRELKEKLRDLHLIAKHSEVKENKEIIEKGIRDLEHKIFEVLYSKAYRDAQKEIPWLEKLSFALRGDVFLRFATVIVSIAAILTITFIAIDFKDVSASIGTFLMLLFAIGKAAAQAQTSVAFSAKDGLRYLILIAITLGFVCAMAILAFSNKADARKFAADMIKTILGVYAGMATKLID